MAKAVNPIKAIKGGVTQVKNTATAVKMNNQNVKNGTALTAMGKPAPTKLTMGPKQIVKSFVAGAKDPKGAATRAGQLKAMKKA
mgnify:CR=1 FL=1